MVGIKLPELKFIPFTSKGFASGILPENYPAQ